MCGSVPAKSCSKLSLLNLTLLQVEFLGSVPKGEGQPGNQMPR